MSYEDRMRRVARHIFDNPAGDLSLDALADVAALSRFHFHRLYHAMTGETAAQAVRRIRLFKAAAELCHSNTPPDQIAAEVGYPNFQSFSRVFKAQYGATPLAFRANGRAPDPGITFRKGPRPMIENTIRTRPAIRLAALAHRGAYSEIGRAFTQLAAVFSARNLWDQAGPMLGVYYDSPADTAPGDLRSHAGIAVGPDFEMPKGLEEVHLEGGPHLVVTVKGPYANLPAAWEQSYAKALPASGRLPAHRPPFEVYLNDPTNTAPADLLTEITIPLSA